MNQILAKQMSGQVQPMSSSEVIGVIMKISLSDTKPNNEILGSKMVRAGNCWKRKIIR